MAFGSPGRPMEASLPRGLVVTRRRQRVRLVHAVMIMIHPAGMATADEQGIRPWQ